MIRFRTVRRLCLILLPVVLIGPAAVIVGRALYYRSDAYCRRVARGLADALGTRVSIGAITRLGDGRMTLTDVSIGGSDESPVLSAPSARVGPIAEHEGLHLTLENALLAVGSRRDLDDLIRMADARGAIDPPIRSVRFDDARCVWQATGGVSADRAAGHILLLPGGKRASVGLTLSRGDDGIVSTDARRTAEGWSVGAEAPGAVLAAFGLAGDLPVDRSVFCGSLQIPGGSREPVVGLDLAFADLVIGPLAERWGVPGVQATALGTFTGRVQQWGGLLPEEVEVRGTPGEMGTIEARALRRLACLVEAEAPDLPDTAGRLTLSDWSLTVAVADGHVVLGGGMEPAGSVVTGCLVGDTEPRVLLRLNRTRFTLEELRERLAYIRTGGADAPQRPPASRPASRPTSREGPRESRRREDAGRARLAHVPN